MIAFSTLTAGKDKKADAAWRTIEVLNAKVAFEDDGTIIVGKSVKTAEGRLLAGHAARQCMKNYEERMEDFGEGEQEDFLDIIVHREVSKSRSIP